MNFRTKILLVICILCTILATSGLVTPKIADYISPVNVAIRNMPKIIIDPGHGGIDGGASTADGYPEKNINLAISLKLSDMFKTMGYDVILTRQTDISIHDPELKTTRKIKVSDIKNRMKIMESEQNSLFISIHQNHFSIPKYFGTQVFYSPNNEESKLLANAIKLSVNSILQPDNNREIKKSTKDIYLLYNAKSTAVMVECGFLSNKIEAEKLKTDDYQNKMAFSILCGVLEYSQQEKVKS